MLKRVQHDGRDQLRLSIQRPIWMPANPEPPAMPRIRMISDVVSKGVMAASLKSAATIYQQKFAQVVCVLIYFPSRPHFLAKLS